MGDVGRKSARIQQLSQFALSDSVREKVSCSLRKRSKPLYCEEENGIHKEELTIESSNGNPLPRALVVKVRSTRAKRSDKVGTGAQVAKPGGSTRLHSTIVEREVVRNADIGDAKQGDYKILNASFYECDALELAPRLLGKLIRRDDVILQITEVEAYRPGDSACHGRVGQTARTAPLFGPGGHAYVYLCYGLHVMLNVVADRAGVGAAVLIRACSPVAGLSSIQLRRGQVTEKPVLLTGPGKVGQALGLTTEWSSHPLYSEGGLEILDAPLPSNILVGPRVGIDYAEPKDVAALWRFAIADNPWVSAPRATLGLLQPQ
ncbi:unnamed protein product [Calypogeia fissa]